MRTIFLLEGAYSPHPTCLGLPPHAFTKQKNMTVPGAERRKTEGKRIKIKVMEDVTTIILIVVICFLLKPILGAILRGFGSSEHRRDR